MVSTIKYVFNNVDGSQDDSSCSMQEFLKFKEGIDSGMDSSELFDELHTDDRMPVNSVVFYIPEGQEIKKIRFGVD